MSFVSLLWTFTVMVNGADLRLDGGAEFGWETNKWKVVVDGVMGGKSLGSLEFLDSDRTMVFSGNIDLDGGDFQVSQSHLRLGWTFAILLALW